MQSFRDGTPPVVDLSAHHLANLHAEIAALRESVRDEGNALLERWSGWLKRPEFSASARNLASHLALRRRDLGSLQMELARYGISSPGRNEAGVLESLSAIAALLARATGRSELARAEPCSRVESTAGRRRLHEESVAVFGEAPPGRRVRIMATLSGDRAGDQAFARQVLQHGADLVRINLAHDDEKTWASLVRGFREEARTTGLDHRLRIMMELAGPKIRTRRFDSNGERRRFGEGDNFWLARALPDLPEGEPGIGCSLPEVVGQLRSGDPVWLDDGELGGRVVERRFGAVRIEITHAPADGKRLKSDKRLSFPATELAVPALTAEDLAVLPFALRHADLIGCSFVQGADDVIRLQAAIDELATGRDSPPALMMKIQTRRAVRNLPEIIVASAGRNPTALMIARGDLDVEIGHERLAQTQEEILRLCEAAAIPVLWTTPALEGLAKRGPASRREVTDAAIGTRAECLLLNKGPHLLRAIDLLADVLTRMESHQQRTSARLRALHSWEVLFGD